MPPFNGYGGSDYAWDYYPISITAGSGDNLMLFKSFYFACTAYNYEYDAFLPADCTLAVLPEYSYHGLYQGIYQDRTAIETFRFTYTAPKNYTFNENHPQRARMTKAVLNTNGTTFYFLLGKFTNTVPRLFFDNMVWVQRNDACVPPSSP